MMTDPIADMLTRIRNASLARKTEVSLPYSKIKFAIAEILLKEGYILSAEKVRSRIGSFDDLQVVLKYGEGKKNAIHILKRISKPGSRIYMGHADLKKSGVVRGFRIVSTPQGLMTDKEAIKRKLGGEIICEIY
ncbi:30S ribosomal protein S8 [Candidatus Uhrbacteria bacterium]|nr:30S ribosomal protein S8 [Candidatus Uhrbacteria bacterium]